MPGAGGIGIAIDRVKNLSMQDNESCDALRDTKKVSGKVAIDGCEHRLESYSKGTKQSSNSENDRSINKVKGYENCYNW